MRKTAEAAHIPDYLSFRFPAPCDSGPLSIIVYHTAYCNGTDFFRESVALGDCYSDTVRLVCHNLV